MYLDKSTDFQLFLSASWRQVTYWKYFLTNSNIQKKKIKDQQKDKMKKGGNERNV